MAQMMPQYKSSSVITRYNGGAPVLTKMDVPYTANQVFNAGVTKYNGKYIMVFRNDCGYVPGGKTDDIVTNLGLATSNDGLSWKVAPKPVWSADMLADPEITRLYDPRLTVIDGRCYLCFAVDTHHGLRGGVAVTEDFERFEILSLSAPDNRNMVLFPEKVNGEFVRLERPFPVYSRTPGADRFDTWMSTSPDLRYWGNTRLVFGVEDVPFANDKVGPGAPPIKTDKGWLTTFHAVHKDPSRGKNGWEESWQKCYFIGIMLLDLQNPSRILGYSKAPLLAPETRWETEEGFRTNVVFPGGMILEEKGEVKIYYGASDTVECLATAHVDDLLRLCLE